MSDKPEVVDTRKLTNLGWLDLLERVDAGKWVKPGSFALLTALGCAEPIGKTRHLKRGRLTDAGKGWLVELWIEVGEGIERA